MTIHSEIRISTNGQGLYENTCLTIPIIESKLGLGTWQGIYLWEHRNLPHQRCLIISQLS